VLVNVAGGPAGRTEQGGGAEFPDGWTDLLPELNQQPGTLRRARIRDDLVSSQAVAGW
jgi:hypothetical protein